ncbi:hypothetical protein Fmac_009809 [Flemingia macrophylla]|uniref:Uncharacterized protein n=1 Tax=Flemingia macrophylla TaxID=520843 RepID=A0ABD1N197_9FABA
MGDFGCRSLIETRPLKESESRAMLVSATCEVCLFPPTDYKPKMFLWVENYMYPESR